MTQSCVILQKNVHYGFILCKMLLCNFVFISSPSILDVLIDYWKLFNINLTLLRNFDSDIGSFRCEYYNIFFETKNTLNYGNNNNFNILRC